MHKPYAHDLEQTRKLAHVSYRIASIMVRGQSKEVQDKGKSTWQCLVSGSVLVFALRFVTFSQLFPCSPADE